MIWLTLAHATTPEDLAAKLPEARAQLVACEAGCTADAGAQAAYVVAVGTYVDTGVADGTLAATVKALDPALFAKLPPVLQEASSTPMGWVATPSHPPEPQGEAPMVPQPWPLELTVRIRDASGAPVPAASIEVVGEGVSRAVDAEGTWRTGGIWKSTPVTPVDGQAATFVEPVYFEKGQVITLLVRAPDHELLKATVVLNKNPKRNVFTLVMQDPK